MKGDWVLTVKENIDELDLKMTFLEIRNTSKDIFKNIVKDKVKIAAFNYMTKLQALHSKSINIKYSKLKGVTQNFLISCFLATTTSNIHQIQKVRSVLKSACSEDFKTVLTFDI